MEGINFVCFVIDFDQINHNFYLHPFCVSQCFEAYQGDRAKKFLACLSRIHRNLQFVKLKNPVTLLKISLPIPKADTLFLLIIVIDGKFP